MQEENTTTDPITKTTVEPVVETPVAMAPEERPARFDRRSRGPRRGSKKPDRTRVKPEFDSKIITIRRVARVVAGGRRFTFSVALVVGNRKGMVGVGLAKAGDTAQAIDKATREAKKDLVKINTTQDMSIPHEVSAKYSSARIVIIPAKDRGVVAGSALRTVLELAGIKNVVAKIISPSKNKLNIARATIKALSSFNLEKPISVKK